MSYCVQVIGPAGRVTYLARGKEVGRPENATWYPHPSNARQAAERYQRRTTGRVMVNILSWDPEGI